MADVPFDPIAEARRQWTLHWGDAPAPSMSAVTSVMRVQQILMTRLNGLLKPFGLTFPRYEALMILRLSRRGEETEACEGRCNEQPMAKDFHAEWN